VKSEQLASGALVEPLGERSVDGRSKGFDSDRQLVGEDVVAQHVGEHPREQRVESLDEIGDDRRAARAGVHRAPQAREDLVEMRTPSAL